MRSPRRSPRWMVHGTREPKTFQVENRCLSWDGNRKADGDPATLSRNVLVPFVDHFPFD